MRFLDRFSAVLLDMNGTFMFGHDRLGVGEDFGATYRRLGGVLMSDEAVSAAIRTTLEVAGEIYARPERCDAFPSMVELLRAHTGAPQAELARLDAVIGAHERGEVSEAHAGFLRRLAERHTLGIVSNLFASPQPWKDYLRSKGLRSLFSAAVFSSEGASIKPSPRLFERAVAGIGAHEAILFVGDSLRRDIIPAKALGMSTAWIAPDGSAHPAADVVVSDLLLLEQRA